MTIIILNDFRIKFFSNIFFNNRIKVSLKREYLEVVQIKSKFLYKFEPN
jgi:hypothetical protein